MSSSRLPSPLLLPTAVRDELWRRSELHRPPLTDGEAVAWIGSIRVSEACGSGQRLFERAGGGRQSTDS